MNILENVHRQQWKLVRFFSRLVLLQRYRVIFALIQFLTMFGRFLVGRASSPSHSRIVDIFRHVSVQKNAKY